MTLSFKDLEFRTEVPDIPRSLPVTQTIAQCAPERSRSVRALADHFKLGDLVEVGLPWGYALGNDAGQVEFFSASGGAVATSRSSMHSTTSAASGRRPPPSTLRPAGNGCSARSGPGS